MDCLNPDARERLVYDPRSEVMRKDERLCDPKQEQSLFEEGGV